MISCCATATNRKGEKLVRKTEKSEKKGKVVKKKSENSLLGEKKSMKIKKTEKIQ